MIVAAFLQAEALLARPYLNQRAIDREVLLRQQATDICQAHDFGEERFDAPRAVQIRLAAFESTSLLAVGRRVRDIYATGRPNEARLRTVVDDEYLDTLARAVAGGLGGKVSVAPRLYLKKLVSDVTDRVDRHEDFDPRKHYALTLTEAEMSPTDRAAAGASTVDDIDL